MYLTLNNLSQSVTFLLFLEYFTNKKYNKLLILKIYCIDFFKLQSEAKQKNLYTLQRSFELQQEQEEEVKRATSVILATKCKAIRDAQIAEKTVIFMTVW